MVEYPANCPKCGVALDENSRSRSPTWVSPNPKKTDERRKLNEAGRIWCRKCAVEYHTKEPRRQAVVGKFTAENWHFNPRAYSKQELTDAREIAYLLWQAYHGYVQFDVTRFFFMEIFSRTLKNCKEQSREMRFSDILETEEAERSQCEWDWLS